MQEGEVYVCGIMAVVHGGGANDKLIELGF